MSMIQMLFVGSNIQQFIRNDGSIMYPNNSFLLMSPGINFGSGTFTIECWFYTTNANKVVIIGAGGTGTNGGSPFPNFSLSFYTTNSGQWYIVSSNYTQITWNMTTPIQANTWTYVAVTRDSGGYFQVWQGTNGTAAASSTGRQHATINFTNYSYEVGGLTDPPTYNNSTNISSLRVTNTNVYSTTASTIPIPTTPLTAISGTTLLMTQSQLLDISGNQTLSMVGNVTSSSSSAP